MPTRTLRQLERDGVVKRHDLVEVPPRTRRRGSDTDFEGRYNVLAPVDAKRSAISDFAAGWLMQALQKTS
jgi:hypothetical protein